MKMDMGTTGVDIKIVMTRGAKSAGLGLRVWGLGFRVEGLGFMDQCWALECIGHIYSCFFSLTIFRGFGQLCPSAGNSCVSWTAEPFLWVA